ncbi:MAG: trypsin-like peptidase domain-containing protein [Candidatus Eremiobacteraeota bacterium]|nr:trypsin-like peptidase domain-containing protein [Candidatus Eremiobacteraeota bacterium]MBV9737020.1 trypsin-like peptidase domain-containing protein [Candidatus Eremiobacteraeota bacterium]
MPTLIVALSGAVIGSFAMMLYASTHFANVAGPNNTPPAISAAPVYGGASDQDRIVSAVKRVEPSVVAIDLVVNGQQVFPNDPFSQFFGGNAPPQRYQARASGSGFVYKSNGEIVTNAHVVTPPSNGTISRLEVLFHNGDHVPAHVISTNINADLAIIKVDGYSKLPPPVELGNSDRLEAGQWAIAIGEPLQLQHSVTVGVVSGFNREEPIRDENGGYIDFKGLLQTSAPINPGNSGGPLVDIDGRVIGVNQSTASPTTAQGIGFAIPSNIVRSQMASLEQNPGVHQGTNVGFIGAQLGSLNNSVRQQINYNGPVGVVVAQVLSGTPADQAGLQPGDIILRANGQGVTDPQRLIAIIRAAKPGQQLSLEVWSRGIKRLATVSVSERPADYYQPTQQQP